MIGTSSLRIDAACCAFFFGSLASSAQFASPDTLSWSVANGAQCVQAADLDEDGDNDVVVGTRFGHHVLLYRNPGDGQFGQPEYVMEAEGVYDLELVDLDLDGDVDVVVGDFGNGWLSWSANSGDGAFAPRSILCDDIFTTGITAVEVGQGDGDPDLEIFTLNYVGRAGVFKDTGNQQYGTGFTLFNAGPPAFGLDIIKYNGAFRYDVIGGGDEVWMRSNTGGGFLGGTPVQLSSAGGDVSAVSFDPGTNGTLDQVRVYVASEGTGQLRIWSGFQNGTPSLASTTAYDGITDIEHHVVDTLNPGIWWPELASHTLHGLVGNTLFFTNSRAWGLRGIHVADMDGDAIEDLIWCGDEDDDVAWVKRDTSAGDHPEYRMTPLSGGTRPPSFADLDGDGDTDVVLAFQEGRSIGWIENDGNGQFGETSAITIHAYDHSKAIPADIDGDGDKDVLTAYGYDTLLYFPNDGLGGFGPSVIISDQYADAAYLQVLDAEPDGDVDILTVAHAGNGVPVERVLLLNDGAGNFTPSLNLPQGLLQFDRWWDMDGDALPDILERDPVTSRLSWYRNTGGGAFANAEEILPGGTTSTIRSMCLGDADEDGDADLILAGDYGAFVYWMERTTTGWNAPALLFGDPDFNITGLVMGDFDADGDEDLLTGRYDGGRVVWYVNNGGLSFGPGVELTDELMFNVHVDAVDLNGDGNLDGVASSSPADRVLAFLNTADISTSLTEVPGTSPSVQYDPSARTLIISKVEAGTAARVHLLDQTGRAIGTWRKNATNPMAIPVGSIASGSYVLVISDGRYSHAQRVSIW